MDAKSVKVAEMIDWDAAAASAIWLTDPGPQLSRSEAQEVVHSLRRAATRAAGYVPEVTGLSAPLDRAAPVLVVDRPGLIRANVTAFSQILAPADGRPAPTGLVPKASGVQLGLFLSYLAPRILGQFDPYGPVPGRLLLVAPNVVQVERAMEVNPADFRLWVCLHEETHRLQFTAVPWLRDHLLELIRKVVDTIPTDWSALTRALGSVGRSESTSMIDLILDSEQRALVDQITAVMTLLEGHADYMMDQVGPEVIGTIAEIRSRFNRRRQGRGIDRVIRRLLGLDAKLRQYQEGSAFVSQVVATLGLAGFNQVWRAPENLPTLAEFGAPQRWIARVRPTLPDPS